MKIPEDKIVVLKYGIDHTLFKPGENHKEKEKIALFVGRGSLPKGFDTLISAAKKIKGKIVAVASQIPRDLQKMIDDIDNITIVTSVSQQELVTLYQDAYVFVMPSLAEGSPLTTLEAMACGLPIVCSEEGSGEYIKDGINGFLFPFKDSNQLAEQVNYLFEHKNLADQFGAFNREKVENELTLDIITSQTMDIYKKMIHADQN
jgi:glycosyltransferase involved in cell wall biosynthesis